MVSAEIKNTIQIATEITKTNKRDKTQYRDNVASKNSEAVMKNRKKKQSVKISQYTMHTMKLLKTTET